MLPVVAGKAETQRQTLIYTLLLVPVAISLCGLFVFLFGLVQAFLRKQQAAANPWGAGATTLEWTLPSPPPFHQFEVLPRIR